MTWTRNWNGQPPRLTRRPRLSLLALEDRTTPSTTGLVETGFETPSLPIGQFRYQPTGSAWSFAGPAGISANGSGFTAANANAPQGSQVAFLQSQSSISQVGTFVAGTYVVNFSAAARSIGSQQTLQVLVDGVVVGTYNQLTNRGYAAVSSSSFNLAAGSHTISFVGTNLFGGDATLFIDNVSVTPQAGGLADSSFERPALTPGGFQYAPSGTPWSFTGPAGIATNFSGFTSANPIAPQGNQVLFLQANGGASQTASFAAGTYTISFFAAQRAGGGHQTFNILVNGKIVGTFNYQSSATYASLVTSTFTVGAGNQTITLQGTNLVGGDNTVFIDALTINQQAAGLADSGFEALALAPNSFKYNPTGTPWSFAGSAGVAANDSAFTSGNPLTPQGSQVLFLQGQGAVSQIVNFAAGNYTLNFLAAQRGNGGGAQTFQVLVDGKAITTVNNLSGIGFTSLTTSTFNVTAGNHTITIQGTNLAGGDNTAFIDQVSVVRSTAGFTDSSFEAPTLGAGSFRYNPTGTAWSFTGSSGIAANNSGFTAGNAPAPGGSQVAFLQNTATVSQTTSFAAGTYTVFFSAAQRANVASRQTFQVLLNGNVIGTYNFTGGPGYTEFATSSFTVPAGNHTVAFRSTNLVGGDNTILIDNVKILQEPASLGDSGFEAPPLAYGAFQYAPTGSAWTFTGSAGITADGSAFTSRNDLAPQGGQVAFLQQTGSMSQVVNFPTAGVYDISFFVAQRRGYGGAQTFRILIDGSVVGIFNGITDTAYVSGFTEPFTLPAGNHTITFQGTNLTGGDNTLFIDQVTITAIG